VLGGDVEVVVLSEVTPSVVTVVLLVVVVGGMTIPDCTWFRSVPSSV
jgi:hypothetical protein